MGTTAYAERRDPTAPRRPFRATVDLAPNDDHDAYQADAIDLSISGMSVRTQMLPDVGEQLAFHFSLADGRPVDGRAEVIWAHDKGDRAGAFGVKFMALPSETEAALRQAMDGGSNTPGTPTATDETRVKLFIHGMDAPLRARVRHRGEDTMVLGSDLSFLRLGEKVEVDNTRERTAGTIESVGVEVDPRTGVPRLVLTVDLLCRPRRDPAAARPAEPVASPVQPAHAPVPAAPMAMDPTASPAPTVTAPRARPGVVRNAAQATTVLADDPSLDDGGPYGDDTDPATDTDDLDDMSPGPSWLKGAVGSVKLWGARAATSAGPVMRRATVAVGSLGQRVTGAVRARIAARTGTHPAVEAPTRAPRNGLRPQHATDSDVGVDVDGNPTSSRRTRRMVVYAAAALALAAGIVAVASTGGPRTTPPHPQVTIAATDTAAATAGALPAPGDTTATDTAHAGQNPSAAEDTAEPGTAPVQGVPHMGMAHGTLPPDLAAAAVSPSARADEAPILGISRPRVQRAPGMVFRPTAAAMAPTVRGAGTTPAVHTVVFGNPAIHVGTTLHLRMDGPVTALTGVGARGGAIVLDIPGRHSLDVASPLTRLDPRLSGATVFNRPSGAVLTLRFREPAPPFVARATGNTVEIVLGNTPGAARPQAAAARPRAATAPVGRSRVILGRRR